MQQIYMQSDEQFEVFTTVFSPQVCRSRTRMQQMEGEKVVAAINYRALWPEELELSHGDVIQVLFKEDHSWWFGRLQNGKEGYFPAACVTTYTQGAEPATPSLLRRGSVPAVVGTPDSPCGHNGGRGTPKFLRKNSIRRAAGHEGPSVASGPAPQGSPSLLHRVLARSRRKSCPHLPHLPHLSLDTGSINTAFQPD